MPISVQVQNQGVESYISSRESYCIEEHGILKFQPQSDCH